MNCTIRGCPGQYEVRRVVHTVQRGEDILVFENVPVEVCNVCSDTLLSPETVRRLEELMRRRGKPGKYAPLYDYV